MKHTALVIGIIFGLYLLATVPESCQRKEAIQRLAEQQQSALERGDIESAKSLNEQIENLTDNYSEPADNQ